MTEQDHYEEALEQIRRLVVKLHGGYYEPRSDRDRQLGLDLWDLYERSVGTPYSHTSEYDDTVFGKNQNTLGKE